MPYFRTWQYARAAGAPRTAVAVFPVDSALGAPGEPVAAPDGTLFFPDETRVVRVRVDSVPFLSGQSRFLDENDDVWLIQSYERRLNRRDVLLTCSRFRAGIPVPSPDDQGGFTAPSGWVLEGAASEDPIHELRIAFFVLSGGAVVADDDPRSPSGRAGFICRVPDGGYSVGSGFALAPPPPGYWIANGSAIASAVPELAQAQFRLAFAWPSESGPTQRLAALNGASNLAAGELWPGPVAQDDNNHDLYGYLTLALGPNGGAVDLSTFQSGDQIYVNSGPVPRT